MVEVNRGMQHAEQRSVQPHQVTLDLAVLGPHQQPAGGQPDVRVQVPMGHYISSTEIASADPIWPELSPTCRPNVPKTARYLRGCECSISGRPMGHRSRVRKAQKASPFPPARVQIGGGHRDHRPCVRDRGDRVVLPVGPSLHGSGVAPDLDEPGWTLAKLRRVA